MARRGIFSKVALAATLMLGLAVLPSSAAESPNFPGVPSGPNENSGNWVGPRASGINEIVAAKQWARLPPVYVLAFNIPATPQTDTSCRRLKPYEAVTHWHATMFYISTAAGAPEPYGYIGPFTVRTAAFGSIPVEAEVLIGQPRDADNLPIGYEVKQTTNVFCAGLGPNAGPTEREKYWEPIDLTAPVDISIVGLKVDGVDLKLSAGCRPAEQSVMKLGSRPYYDLDPSITPEQEPTSENLFTTPFFGLANGGLLSGAVDIGAFTGCRTSSGEDVSPLLTATVSGADNPVEVRSEGLVLDAKECIPDRTNCPAPLPGLPYPERDTP